MPPGITHYLYDYSPDMCFLEIAMAGTPDGMIPKRGRRAILRYPGANALGEGLILRRRALARLSEADGNRIPT